MTIFNDFLFVYMETRTACVEKFARADIWSFRVEVVRKVSLSPVKASNTGICSFFRMFKTYNRLIYTERSQESNYHF